MNSIEGSQTLLLVANYDSAVGYAWWLMESYWAVLARRYVGSHDVIIAYPSITVLPDEISRAPAKPVVMSFTGASLAAIWRQCLFLRHNRVRVIYFSDQEPIHWRYIAFRLAGVRRIVIHDHTPGLRTAPGPVRRMLKRFMHRLPWISADGVIGATEFVTGRHVSVACVPPGKCFVVPNGIRPPDSGRLCVDVRERFSIPKSRRVIVSTGRAHRVKGLGFALRCVEKLVHGWSRSDLHFLHFGDGPHLQEFVDDARALSLESHVTFAGRQDVGSLLESCDIAFHPSTAEVGYSLAILEYMQAGLPVVVSDNPSVCGATLNGETGLIYPEGSVEAAAQAILCLLNDSSAARAMGKSGRRLVSERYSLTRSHAALLQAFQNIDPGFPKP